MNGMVALKKAKDYVDETLKESGSLKGKDGKDGVSPTITENPNNDDQTYKLDITDVNGIRTTPNLKGKDGISSGEGGITDYDDLDNQPKINDVTLQGNKTLDELGIQKKGNYLTEIPTEYITNTELEEKGYLTAIPEQYVTDQDMQDYVQEQDFAKSNDIPTNVSQLNNDEGYLTKIPDNYITEENLIEKGYLSEIPAATTELLGGVKPDGTTITADSDGTIHAVGGGIGQDGKTYTPTIGTIQSGDEAQASVEIDQDGLQAKFNFTLPRGEKGSDGQPGKDGQDGRSITSVRTDENNNVYMTFSDGNEELVGQLSFDVQADFLTSGGFGNLRYYNGHFQYYDTASSQWIDTSVSPDNPYIMNMAPQPMQWIMGVYDHKIGHYKLKWIEPKDTIIENQVAVVVESVMLRKKKDSALISENDGELVAVINRADFGSYENAWFIDQTFTPTLEDVWYYKAFPVSTTGFYNVSPLNETIGIKAKDYELYGFKIDQNESDPASMITYIEDNTQFRSAYMDYTADRFNYADWNIDDAFFMNVKPCMLNYDGTVAYYLNPNDYSLKENGEPSDISDVNFDGNAMVQFPITYWKIANNGDNTANIYISNKDVDGTYKCFSHIDANGNKIPYCYMPAYNGSNQGGVLRSLSGQTPMYNQTAQTEINYALANNLAEEYVIWYTEVMADRQLVNMLLLLIGKSTDTQAVFGQGYNMGCASASNLGTTGQLDFKGLFYGTNANSPAGVKVFGIADWWGKQWRRIAGWINDKGNQKIKMTYGTVDGSETEEYNLTGQGYIEIPNATPNGINGNYCSSIVFTENGFIPKVTNGTATTYYTDGMWFDNTRTNYAWVGGASNEEGSRAGALHTCLQEAESYMSWIVGASISCKPLAQRR